MQKLLIANWKENPRTENEAVALFTAMAKMKASQDVRVVVCPPFIYLNRLVGIARTLKIKKSLALGAQNVFWKNEGSYTGEISPLMLKDLGVEYVIIGHSERRQWLGETDVTINKKINAALDAGLHVVLCVGEPLIVRRKGIIIAQNFIKSQLVKDLKGISRSASLDKLVIAYEPVWAIGTGHNADPADVNATAIFIKKQLSILFRSPTVNRRKHRLPVIYGGSVSGKNIGGYMQYDEVDGALVGGASLKVSEWKEIVSVDNKIN